MIVRPLTEYCTLNMGQSPDSKTYNTQGKGLPFYQGNADFGETHPITRVWCSTPVKVAEEGDILISVRAPIGAMNMAVERCCIGRGLAALTPIRNKCSKQFLYYALQSKVDSLIAQGTGSTFKAISKKVLEATRIPAYSTIEQEQIAETIGHVDNTIAARRKQLALLDQLVKSRFIELFGDPLIEDDRYPRVPLGSLAEVGSSKRIFEKEYVSEGIPFYRTKEIVELSKGNRITTELFITKERYDQIRSEYGAPQKGDLLISAVGTIGVIWIVDGKNNFYFKDGNLLRVSATEKFVPEYLKHLLEALISAYKSEMSSGTAYAALTISALKEMMVYDVPHAEQEQFAAFVEQTDKSKYYSSLSFRYCQAAANTYRQEWMTCRTSDF